MRDGATRPNLQKFYFLVKEEVNLLILIIS